MGDAFMEQLNSLLMGMTNTGALLHAINMTTLRACNQPRRVQALLPLFHCVRPDTYPASLELLLAPGAREQHDQTQHR